MSIKRMKKESVLKFWIKIENFINQKLGALGGQSFKFLKYLIKIFLSLTPHKIKTYSQRQANKIIEKKGIVKERIKNSPQLLKKAAIKTKEKGQSYTRQGIALAKQTTDKVKDYNIKEDGLRHALAASSFFMFYLLKAKRWYISLSPKSLVIGITTTALGTIAGVNMYVSGKKIASQTSPKEEIVQKIEKVKRSPYHHQTLKYIHLEDVKMPVYVESVTAIKFLTLDITIESSNRYIKSFLSEKPHYIQDQLNATIEPIIPTFPLTDEGKDILRDKIIKESNQVLKRLKIKGTVKNVYFHHIMAS
jgi:flagellar basal body-associated protein FliL